jgi:N-formylglutamate deformylase
MTDDELCAAFDSATLPKEAFHHREHLRVAFIYFARHGDMAVPRFCAALLHFATAHDVPAKYRHDLTLDYLERVRDRASGSVYADSEEFLARHPELLRG